MGNLAAVAGVGVAPSALVVRAQPVLVAARRSFLLAPRAKKRLMLV